MEREIAQSDSTKLGADSTKQGAENASWQLYLTDMETGNSYFTGRHLMVNKKSQ